ncbi:unnamed protein product, partial [Medioppia subpectinata]
MYSVIKVLIIISIIIEVKTQTNYSTESDSFTDILYLDETPNSADNLTNNRANNSSTNTTITSSHKHKHYKNTHFKLSLVGIHTVVSAIFTIIYYLCTHNKRDVIHFLVIYLSGLVHTFSGILLNHIKRWTEFRSFSGLTILVNPLMGLKNNLETTTVSRMSSLMDNNVYHLVSWKDIWLEFRDGMVLVQSQSMIMSSVSVFFPLIIEFSHLSGAILCAIGLLTSNTTSFILGIKILSNFPESVAIIVFFIILEPLLLSLSYGNRKTRQILTQSWAPIITSMIISSGSGFIFREADKMFDRLAIFIPLFNRFSGNCMSQHTSGISSSLHRMGPIGTVDKKFKIFVSFYYIFCSKENRNSKTSTILLLIDIPVHILYILVISITQYGEDFDLNHIFVFLYSLVSLIKTTLLLHITYAFTHWVWYCGYDPDIHAIPILRAIIDVIGSAFLFLLFTTDIMQFLIILLSGLIQTFAGLLLFAVKRWPEFRSFTGLMILINPLMGLKGNLEMTTASRMSTLMNIREDLVSWKDIWIEIRDDMILVQSQATIVSFIAILFPLMVEFSHTSGVILCAIGLLTSNTACFILGITIPLVIVMSKHYEMLGHDPDDFATPMASSLGDLVTLIALTCFVWSFVNTNERLKYFVESMAVIVFFIVLEPLLLTITYRNKKTRKILTNSWAPIITAMVISSASGFIFRKADQQFERLATFQPLFNGFSGICVALQASRISTSLHRKGPIGTVDNKFRIFVSFYYILCSKDNPNSRTSIILLVIVIPCHILYILVISITQYEEDFDLNVVFVSLYLSVTFVKSIFLLYITYVFTHGFWYYGHDPDLNAIPILTAIIDVIGSATLFLLFIILKTFNDTNAIDV